MLAFVVVAIGWVLSLCLHEFSHALVAYRGGDTSVRQKGYLTFNPIKYAHPVMSLAMPLLFLLLGGIGLPGGAVYIDRSRLRGREWESMVALAGPAANLLAGMALSAPFLLGLVPESRESAFWPAVAFLALLQFSSVVLNLIPIPPLDGFGAVAPWLPGDLRRSAEQLWHVGFWGLFLVLWYVEAVNGFFWRGVYGLTEAFGVPAPQALEGYRAFRFWER